MVAADCRSAWKREHGAEVRVGEDVAVEDEDEAGHALHRVPYSARGAERLFLHDVGQAHAPGGAVAHGRAHRVHHVGAGEHDVPHAVAREEGELIGEERDVQQRDDRLGPVVGEGTQPRALAPREDDRAYLVGAQGSASPMSITGIPSRMG